MEKPFLPIPAKRYFTIGEVAVLCGVKPHVLRYWEQEFSQLRPMKRRGNRRYYQHHEVLMVRRIRDLLYDQGFTISGARNRLLELVQSERLSGTVAPASLVFAAEQPDAATCEADEHAAAPAQPRGLSVPAASPGASLSDVRRELVEIRALLLDTPETP